jgi:hypothetical protein
MDHTKLIQLELETLKDMYANAASNLKQALLHGAEWETLQEFRHDVTELEIALYNKLRQRNLDATENQNRASAEPELS